MNRNTDCSRLIRNCSCDRLTDPPCCICGELISLSIIKLLYCLDQAKISFLDQVKEKHSTSHISLCNADNQTKICFCKLLLCLLISLFHTFCQFDFFLSTQKRYFTDLFQIHSDRIFNTDPIRYRDIDFIYIYILFQIIQQKFLIVILFCDCQNIYIMAL